MALDNKIRIYFYNHSWVGKDSSIYAAINSKNIDKIPLVIDIVEEPLYKQIFLDAPLYKFIISNYQKLFLQFLKATGFKDDKHYAIFFPCDRYLKNLNFIKTFSKYYAQVPWQFANEQKVNESIGCSQDKQPQIINVSNLYCQNNNKICLDNDLFVAISPTSDIFIYSTKDFEKINKISASFLQNISQYFSTEPHHSNTLSITSNSIDFSKPCLPLFHKINLHHDDFISFHNLVDSIYVKKAVQFDYNFSYLEKNVQFDDIFNTRIGLDIEIGASTKISSNVSILNHSKIGKNCLIDQDAVIKDSIIGDNVIVGYSTLVRNNSFHAGDGIFGALSDISNSSFAKKACSYHLNPIICVDAGPNVMIGASAAFASGNHKLKKSLRTKLDANVLVGCNTTFVAPLHIGSNSLVAAGSTIISNVPKNCLAISRTLQQNKAKYNNK